MTDIVISRNKISLVVLQLWFAGHSGHLKYIIQPWWYWYICLFLLSFYRIQRMDCHTIGPLLDKRNASDITVHILDKSAKIHIEFLTVTLILCNIRIESRDVYSKYSVRNNCRWLSTNICLKELQTHRLNDTVHSLHAVCYIMMTSLNGNIFSRRWPLWAKSTGHRWIPLTKASDV